MIGDRIGISSVPIGYNSENGNMDINVKMSLETSSECLIMTPSIAAITPPC